MVTETFSSATPRRGNRGFTLIEMLVVISITGILAILVSAGLQGITGTAYSNEVSDFANIFVRARAYAMANNTYVFVGIEEVDASRSPNVTQTAGYGRVAVTVVASNLGTRIYSSIAPTALPASNLTIVSPLRHYENLHLTTTSTIPNLPNLVAGTSYNLASSSASSLTSFSWPLQGTAQYTFGNNTNSPGSVIQFNPQGEAQIVTGANTDSILQWIEVDLVPTHGNAVSSTNPDPATILIDGASGGVSTFKHE